MVSFSLHLSFPQGRPESGPPFEKFFLRQSTTGYTLQTFSLSAIYRCVARSCHKVIKQNLYQRKFSCIPHLSKYSCLAFSRSPSVGAVLNVVYNWRFTIISFEPDTGNICISASTDDDQRNALNPSKSARISMNNRMNAYMQIHYKKFIEKENQ